MGNTNVPHVVKQRLLQIKLLPDFLPLEHMLTMVPVLMTDVTKCFKLLKISTLKNTMKAKHITLNIFTQFGLHTVAQLEQSPVTGHPMKLLKMTDVHRHVITQLPKVKSFSATTRSSASWKNGPTICSHMTQTDSTNDSSKTSGISCAPKLELVLNGQLVVTRSTSEL